MAVLNIYTKILPTIATILLITAVLQLNPLKRNSKTSKEILTSGSCTSTECNKIENYVKSAISRGIDPCENFYEFACHGWIEEHPRPPDANFWDVLFQLETKVKNDILEMLKEPRQEESSHAYILARDFFEKCKDQDTMENLGVQRISDILHEYGGWPLLKVTGSWDSSNFNWIKSMTDLQRQFAMRTLLSIDSMQIGESHNDNEMKENFILVDLPPEELPPGMDGLQDPKLYKAGTNECDALKIFIINVAKELMDANEKQNLDMERIEQQAEKVIEFSAKILELTGANEINSELKTKYNFSGNSVSFALKEVDQMIEDFSKNSESLSPPKIKFNLKNVLDHLYENTGLNITSQKRLYIENISYLLGVSRLLENVSVEELANYLHFQMVFKLVPVTTSEMREYFEEFKRNVDGVINIPGREQFGSDLVQKKFHHAIGNEYVNRMRTKEKEEMFTNFEDIKRMYTNVNRGFLEMINESMVVTDKMALTVRLNKTELCLGYPEWYGDQHTTRLTQEYRDLNINASMTFVQQLLSVNTWIENKSLQDLKEPLDTNCYWPSFLGRPEAFTDNYRLKILLHEGLIKPPFYQANRPTSLNYGALGSILGYHQTHGLFGDGWTEGNDEKFAQISECLVDQYNNFSVEDIPDVTSNGKFTLMENIADNAGLLATYKAYKYAEPSLKTPPEKMNMNTPALINNLNGDQLFFLGFAMNWCESHSLETMRKEMQVLKMHSPNSFRVLGSLQNSKEFSVAWNCPLGSNMNKQIETNKCRVL